MKAKQKSPTLNWSRPFEKVEPEVNSVKQKAKHDGRASFVRGGGAVDPAS